MSESVDKPPLKPERPVVPAPDLEAKVHMATERCGHKAQPLIFLRYAILDGLAGRACCCGIEVFMKLMIVVACLFRIFTATGVGGPLKFVNSLPNYMIWIFALSEWA